MTSLQAPAVQQFERRFSELRDQGLVDMKFFVGEVGDATTEDFCEEFLRMDELIKANQSRPLNFGDSTKR